MRHVEPGRVSSPRAMKAKLLQEITEAGGYLTGPAIAEKFPRTNKDDLHYLLEELKQEGKITLNPLN